MIAADPVRGPSKTLVEVGSTPVDIDLVMQPNSCISGMVVDGAGAPAVAVVRIAAASEWQVIRTRHVATDAGGRFELRGVEPGCYHLHADSETGASAHTFLTLGPAVEVQTLVVKPTGSISGLVIDDGGQGRAGIQVAACSVGRGGQISSATTDAGGRFVIPALPLGRYLLGVPSTVLDLQETARTLATTGEDDVRLLVWRPRTIRGRLRIGDPSTTPSRFTIRVAGGLPIAGAADGTFEVRDLPPGIHAMSFIGPEFATHHRDVRIDAGAITDLDTVVADRGRVLAGTVVTPDHRAVAGARITLGFSSSPIATAYEHAMGWTHSTLTDEHGAFSLPGIPIDSTQLILGAVHATHGRAAPIRVPDTDTPILFTLHRCGSITGRVTRDGQPVLGALVIAGQPEATFANTDGTGRFAMSSLPAGTLTVNVEDPPLRQASVVDIIEGATVAVDIELLAPATAR